MTFPRPPLVFGVTSLVLALAAAALLVGLVIEGKTSREDLIFVSGMAGTFGVLGAIFIVLRWKSFARRVVRTPVERVARVELRASSSAPPPVFGAGTIEQHPDGVRVRALRPPAVVPTVAGVVLAVSCVIALAALMVIRDVDRAIATFVAALGILPGFGAYVFLRRHMRGERVDTFVPWSAVHTIRRTARGHVTLRFSDRDLRGDVEAIALDDASADVVDAPWLADGAQRCAMCGLDKAAVALLVASELDRFLCDACVFHSLAALSERGRLLARRRIIEKTCAAWANERALARGRQMLAGLLVGLPPDEHADAVVNVRSDGRRCVLCAAWARGWEGVSSDDVAVCARCVVESALSLMPRPHERIELVLATLAPRPRHAETGPLLDAMLAVAETADELREVARAAAAVTQFATARDALERIPADQRTRPDTYALAFHYAETGNAERALALHRGIGDAIEDGLERAAWLVDEVSYMLAAGGPPELPRWSEQLELARAMLRDAPDDERLRYVPVTYELLAGLHLRADRLDDATAALDMADTFAPPTAERWELRGEICARRGDHPGAETAWHHALEQAHPDGALARRVADRLTAKR